MPVLTSSIINNAEIKDKIYYIWDDIVALPSQPADLELWFWDWLNVCKIADMKSWAANYILRPLILMSYVSA